MPPEKQEGIPMPISHLFWNSPVISIQEMGQKIKAGLIVLNTAKPATTQNIIEIYSILRSPHGLNNYEQGVLIRLFLSPPKQIVRVLQFPNVVYTTKWRCLHHVSIKEKQRGIWAKSL